VGVRSVLGRHDGGDPRCERPVLDGLPERVEFRRRVVLVGDPGGLVADAPDGLALPSAYGNEDAAVAESGHDPLVQQRRVGHRVHPTGEDGADPGGEVVAAIDDVVSPVSADEPAARRAFVVATARRIAAP
jgi:hypothetical protein